MAALRIVEAVNVPADGCLGFRPCLITGTVNEFFLQTGMEGFDARVVIGAPLRLMLIWISLPFKQSIYSVEQYLDPRSEW